MHIEDLSMKNDQTISLLDTLIIARDVLKQTQVVSYNLHAANLEDAIAILQSIAKSNDKLDTLLEEKFAELKHNNIKVFEEEINKSIIYHYAFSRNMFNRPFEPRKCRCLRGHDHFIEEMTEAEVEEHVNKDIVLTDARYIRFRGNKLDGSISSTWN